MEMDGNTAGCAAGSPVSNLKEDRVHVGIGSHYAIENNESH